jgi:hypothetical protein
MRRKSYVWSVEHVHTVPANQLGSEKRKVAGPSPFTARGRTLPMQVGKRCCSA